MSIRGLGKFFEQLGDEFGVVVSGFGGPAGGLVAGFLKRMPGVAARPGPFDPVRVGGPVEAGPEIVVGLAAKFALHGFHDVQRVGNDLDPAGALELFESEAGGDDFGLLIGAGTEKFGHDFSFSAPFEQRGGGGGRVFRAVFQT